MSLSESEKSTLFVTGMCSEVYVGNSKFGFEQQKELNKRGQFFTNLALLCDMQGVASLAPQCGRALRSRTRQ